MIFHKEMSNYFLDRDFIASRRVSLERFLQNIVRHTLLRNALVVRQFLDPHNYTQNFKGIVISALYLNGQDNKINNWFISYISTLNSKYL